MCPRDWTLPAAKLPHVRTVEDIKEEDLVVIGEDKKGVKKKKSSPAKSKDNEGASTSAAAASTSAAEASTSAAAVSTSAAETSTSAAAASTSAAAAPVQASPSGRSPFFNKIMSHTDRFEKCLEFFSSVVPDTSPWEIFKLLTAAWNEDPNVALRCIFHLRDVRNGKSDALKFSDCLLWLYMYHLETLIENLRHVPRTGYWKDLLNFLVRIVQGEYEYFNELNLIRKRKDMKKKQHNIRKNWEKTLEKAKIKREEEPRGPGFHKRPVFSILYKNTLEQYPDINPVTGEKWSKRALKRRRWIDRTLSNIEDGVPQRDSEEIKKEQQERDAAKKEEARILRHKKRDQQAIKACEVFAKNENYRATHIEIARLFAVAMTKDLERMTIIQDTKEASGQAKEPKVPKLTLASKWAPSLDHHHDKITHIATTIAQIMFYDKESTAKEEKLTAEEARVLREQYHKQAITPLREFQKVVESQLGLDNKQMQIKDHKNKKKGQEGQGAENPNEGRGCKQIDYKSVPAVSMQRNRSLFDRYDKERFNQYLIDKKKTKKAKKGKTDRKLKPREIVKVLLSQTSLKPPEESKVGSCELFSQWTSYRDRLQNSRQFDRVLPLVDIYNKKAQPMQAAIALGLLCTEVSQPPYKNLVCAGDTELQLQELIRGTQSTDDYTALYSKVHKMNRMKLAGAFQLEAVFNLTLELALQTGRMVSHVIVFSDVKFDTAIRIAKEEEIQKNKAIGKDKEDKSPEEKTSEKDKEDESKKDEAIGEDKEDESKKDEAIGEDKSPKEKATGKNEEVKKVDFNVQDWSTVHERISKKFQENGYTMPTIVHWNLCHNVKGYPVTIGINKDVVFVNGLSAVDRFLDGKLDLNPFSVMARALERYDFLKVVK